ncbi:MAG: 6-carboxytetrahydropterin synthase QueD [Gammaproteobacteria bacterium HGW-Gammaproteobacteria-1]|jgi:6-pyruvoyltetrahydropterin/6-carboxytetrahydropterin synthase|nr:MAG: 6-carboxytetrahydropterin synthase QueD [Gammaproteobacteria bacterium HGW-Gammaproteobacteria-1]
MTARFDLKVVTDFASAHSLRDYPGDCNRLHGHNWKVEVEVQAASLDELGMVLDFKTIRQAARKVGDELDHRYLNDIPPFDRLNPTAENIAAHFFRRLSEELNDTRAKVSAVTLWETERACVRYTEEA